MDSTWYKGAAWPERQLRKKPTVQFLPKLAINVRFQGGYSLVDDDGGFIAQICHIQAASPKGQRFNSDMTDEERVTHRTYWSCVILPRENEQCGHLFGWSSDADEDGSQTYLERAGV